MFILQINKLINYFNLFLQHLLIINNENKAVILHIYLLNKYFFLDFVYLYIFTVF